jgi:small subunit ribosomal protein S16
MAVSIRLRREGTKNRPYYKVVVADRRSPRDGKFIETIGAYDPKKPGLNSRLNLDRVEYWIGKGAQPSDTVRSLIKKNKRIAAGAGVGVTSEAKPEPSQSAQQEPSPSVETSA